MSAPVRLLATVSVVNVVCRNVHVTSVPQDIKILHMTEITLKRILLGNLHKSASVPEALFSTYLNLAESTAANSAAARRDFNKSIMEPFLDSVYTRNQASSTMHRVSVNIHGEISDRNHENTCPNFAAEFVVENTCSASQDIPYEMQKVKWDKERYKAMRKWVRIGKERSDSKSKDSFFLKLISFNILAQNLLESHLYLYKHHDRNALPWLMRKPLIVEEILGTGANVICLQEMQEDHLEEFLIPFKERGYEYLYKRRTNDKMDGLLLLYRSDQFELLDSAKVEYYQSDVEILNRDNVGLIAKLALKESPDTRIIVATTHLLYNPKRNDVRLAQTQLLFAELERMAFIENTISGPKYLPIILSGDFNLKPFSGVYRFITEGSFRYVGKGRNLEPSDYRSLTNILIPPRLRITDNCEHFEILRRRLCGEGDGKIMLENTERSGVEASKNADSSDGKCPFDSNLADYQKIDMANGQSTEFASGVLTHPFKMKSVYGHSNRHGLREATTHQDEWINVDYIFYSDVELVEKYELPSVKDCAKLPTIPNFAVGSDHLCLGATFKVAKKKRKDVPTVLVSKY